MIPPALQAAADAALVDLLTYPGAGALKMTAPGDDASKPLVLEGRLVVFTDKNRPDLSAAKDFFTAKTDLGVLSERGEYVVPAYYDHGTTVKLSNERIGWAELKADDAGVFARYEITRRQKYVRRVMEELGEEGLSMGQSSGAIPRDVERKAVGDGVHELLAWPIWEASLTPIPAEPLTYAELVVKSIESGLFLPSTGFGTPAGAKAESLSARLQRVQSAAYRQLGERGYPVEVFDEKMVVEMGGKFFEIGYTDDGTAVSFAAANTWVEVAREVSYEPLAKSLGELNDLFSGRAETPPADVLLDRFAQLNTLFTRPSA